MVFTELCMMTVVRFSQSEIAYSHIQITYLQMVVDSKFLHQENTSMP